MRHAKQLCIQFIIAVLVIWLMPAIPESFAAPLPEIQDSIEETHTIAFLPGIPIYMYKDVPMQVSIDTVELQNDIMAHAAAHPYLKVLSERDIRRAFQPDDYASNDVYSQAEIDLGYAETQMSGMNYDTAISLLQRVIQNELKALLNYYQPSAVARAYQMLAYAYVAKYQEDAENSSNHRHSAKLAFMEFIRLAPHIMMLTGRQSPDRVSIYDEALELFLSNDSYRQMPQRDAMALAHRLHADSVISMRIVQNTSGEQILEIDHYNAKKRTMSNDKLPLSQIRTLDPDSLAQSVSNTATAYFSNLYACLDFKPYQPKTTTDIPFHRFLLDIEATYTFFIRHPTSNMLHGFGANINFAAMLNQNFFVRIGGEFISMFPDDDHELYESFRIYRFPVYFGIARTWKYLRPYLGAGLEFSFSSKYTITSSVICKTFGTSDIECNAGDVKTNSEPYALGIPFVFGLNAGYDPFYITVEGSFAPTVYPVKSNAFRHPLSFRLGVQYRF